MNRYLVLTGLGQEFGSIFLRAARYCTSRAQCSTWWFIPKARGHPTPDAGRDLVGPVLSCLYCRLDEQEGHVRDGFL